MFRGPQPRPELRGPGREIGDHPRPSGTIPGPVPRSLGDRKHIRYQECARMFELDCITDMIKPLGIVYPTLQQRYISP